jgi:hypothetical protein
LEIFLQKVDSLGCFLGYFELKSLTAQSVFDYEEIFFPRLVGLRKISTKSWKLFFEKVDSLGCFLGYFELKSPTAQSVFDYEEIFFLDLLDLEKFLPKVGNFSLKS